MYLGFLVSYISKIALIIYSFLYSFLLNFRFSIRYKVSIKFRFRFFKYFFIVNLSFYLALGNIVFKINL